MPTFVAPGNVKRGEIQFGLEDPSAPGVAVTASRKLKATVTITPHQNNDTPEIMSGDLDMWHEVAAQEQWVDVTIASRVYLGDLLLPSFSLFGEAVPSVVVAGDAWLWEFDSTGAADKRSLTLRMNDGQNSWVMPFLVLKTMNLTNAEAREMGLTWTGYAHALNLEGLTGGLTLPVEDPYQSWQRTMYIDGPNATPGTTEYPNTNYGFDLRIDNGCQLIYAGSNDNNFSHVSYDHFTGTCQVNVLDTVGVDGSVGAIQYLEYQQRVDQITRLAVRGPLITGTTYNRLNIDLMGRWANYGKAPFKNLVAAQLAWLPHVNPVQGTAFRMGITLPDSAV